LFSGLLTKYHGLKPLLVGVPYPVVYEIPAKRKQPPPQPKYPNYDLPPDDSDFDLYSTNTRRDYYALSEVEKKMVDNFRQQQGQSDQGFYSDSTPERRYYSRDQGGQGGQGGQRGKRGQGGQGGPGWQRGQGGQRGQREQGGPGWQGGQGEQLGPSGYSRAPTRDTVDISEYEESPVEFGIVR
jgi:hypothetical protein